MTNALPALLAVTLSVAGAGIAITALRRPLRWRRLAAGTLFITAGALSLWVQNGGSLPQPRAVVVVFTYDAKAEDLQLVAASLGSADRVAWLHLTTNKAANQKPPHWMPAEEATRQPGEPAEEFRARLHQSAVDVTVTPDDWFQPVLIADRKARDEFSAPMPTPLYQYSLLFLYDPGATWASLRPQGINLQTKADEMEKESALASLGSPPTDVFVLQAPSAERPGQLVIDLNTDVVPAGSVGALGAARANLRLVGARSVRRKGKTYPVRAWIDGGPGQSGSTQLVYSEPDNVRTDPDPDPAIEPIHSLELASFRSLNKKDDAILDEGWHRLHVRLTVSTEKNGVPMSIEYAATRYFKAERQHVLFLQPELGLGMANVGWLSPTLKLPPNVRFIPPPSASSLVKDYLNHPRGGQVLRTNLSSHNIRESAFSGDLDAIAAEVKKCRTLVLVEPDAEFLRKLEEKVPLEPLIRDGVTVLVIGPPPELDAGPPLPKWLPLASTPVKAGDPNSRLVHRDRRVYFLPDNARLLQSVSWSRLANRNNSDLTGVTMQRDVINALCKDLHARDAAESGTNVSDYVQVSKDASGLNSYTTTTGPARIRVGRIPGASGEEVPVAIYPPVSNYLALSDTKELETRPQWLWETGTSFLPLRTRHLKERIKGLDAIPAPVVKQDIPHEALYLDEQHLYPGTSVVLFMADMPQPREMLTLPFGIEYSARFKAITEPNKPVPGLSDSPPDISALKKLAGMAATVYVVRIRLPQGHAEAIKDAFGKVPYWTLDEYLAEAKRIPELAPFIVDSLVLDLSDKSAAGPTNAAASLDAVKQQLSTLIRGQQGAIISRERAGRVIDERTIKKRNAPEGHRILVPTKAWKQRTNDLDPDHARIQGPKLPDQSDKWTAIAARPLGEGHVVVSAYSPFAPDMWRPDVKDAGLPDHLPVNSKTPEGWGVQRILDAADLTTPRRSVPSVHPIVRGVREADDGATIWIDCWANFHKGGWEAPTIRNKGVQMGKGDELLRGTVYSIDRLTRTITYEFRNTGKTPLSGSDFELWLSEKEKGVEAQPPIYLNLQPSSDSGRSAREALTRLAGLSGGGELNGQSAKESMKFARPLPWFATFALVFTAILLFLPPLRPWSLLRRWRRTGDARLRDRRPTARFDVDAVLTEWGLNPGEPKAARQAGLPGGQKPFESGDSLSVALPATLFSLTTSGGKVLPAKRPIVRRRHITRAIEAVMLLDCTPSLLVPRQVPGKVEYVELIARLITGAVWGVSGSVQIRSLQNPALVWGPRPAGDSADDLPAFIREALKQGVATSEGGLQPPEDLLPGHVLYLISDLLASREEEVRALLGYCAREEVSFRLAHLVGSADPQMFGLTRSALSGALLDRTEWDEVDMDAAIREHIAQSRAMVEGGEARFASVSTDLSAGDVFERLVAQRFFD